MSTKHTHFDCGAHRRLGTHATAASLLLVGAVCLCLTGCGLPMPFDQQLPGPPSGMLIAQLFPWTQEQDTDTGEATDDPDLKHFQKAPFGDVPKAPNWNSTLWDISSPDDDGGGGGGGS